MNCFEFKDSLSFLNSSLDTLVKNLKEKGHEFALLNQCGLVPPDKPELKNLMTKKLYYPYQYLDNVSVLNDKHLPTIESFASDLTGENITEAQYKEAHKMYEDMKCDTFGDYTSKYCLLDVILLCEVVFAFREKMLTLTELDPLNYISLPSFSFDVFLKKTGTTIECLSDLSMVLFVEQQVYHSLSFKMSIQ